MKNPFQARSPIKELNVPGNYPVVPSSWANRAARRHRPGSLQSLTIKATPPKLVMGLVGAMVKSMPAITARRGAAWRARVAATWGPVVGLMAVER